MSRHLASFSLIVTLVYSCVCYFADVNLALAQAHKGRMDTDGVLSPGEIPNPNIDYRNRPDNKPEPTHDDCSLRKRGAYVRPHIEIYKTKSKGNFFGDKVKVQGAVEGVCLSEANLFENGRPVQTIPINTIPSFKRFEFEVTTKLAKSPEIRAYNTAGDSDEASIGDDSYDTSRDDSDYRDDRGDREYERERGYYGDHDRGW